MSTCLFCGSPERKFTSKFCNDCGNGWPAHQVVDKPADVHRYVESLYQSVQSSQFDAGTEKMIKKMRESFKISQATNERIMADLRERLKIVEEMHKFKLEFNQNDSDAYAEQDTLLQFRLSNNADGEQLKSVELTWDDPDSASGRAFRASSAMPVRPGATLSLQGSHVFMRFGPKSIDRMKLRVELPWGDVGEFILEAMVFNVRNADQKISKNITNNISMERGVLDNSNNLSDADGAPLSVGRQAIWKEISLYPKVQHPDDIQDLIETQADQAETAPSATPTHIAKVAAEKTETQNTAAQNAAHEPDQARAEAAMPAKPDITAPQETLPAIAAVTQPKGEAAGNSLVSSQDPSACDDPRVCAIQVLKSLAWFAQASPISKPNTVITSDQFDLDFLDTIYHVVPDAVEDAVLGMVFQDGESVQFDAHRCVTHFDQAAFVVTDFGIIQVKSDEEGDLIPEMTNSWSDGALAGWGFHARRFGDDKFVISFGDGSLSQTLPGCKFDLRRYQGEVPVTQVLAEAQAWLQRLYDLSPVHESDDNSDTDALPATQSTPTEAAWPFDSQEEEGGTNEFTEDEDSSEDEARAQTLNEISLRMQRFFGTFSFAMQRCDENQVRDIYIVDQIDPDLRNTLHEAVYFSGSGMLVVCVEPACALVNDSGLLVGWKGVASVLSAEGIFHMTAQTPGKFMLDGNNAFLSWTRFFDELKADLMVREEGPDLWLGTSMNHLLRGCYADYSSQVLQWDYFENYVHAELRKQLDLFRESLDWI
jgi:hypothetical protein